MAESDPANAEFWAGQRQARIDALERATDHMSDKLDSIQRDLGELKVSVAQLHGLFEEHKVCQGRIAKLETAAATGKGVLLTIGSIGGVLGAAVGALVTWLLSHGRHP